MINRFCIASLKTKLNSQDKKKFEELINNDSISIAVEVIDYSNFDINSVMLHWKYSAEDGPFSQVSLNLDEGVYKGTFPQLNSNVLIEYYIAGTTSTSRSISHPNVGWHIFTSPDSVVGDINGDDWLMY